MATTPDNDQHSGIQESVAHPQANGRAAPVERVERWPIAKLLPYAGNPKTHPPEQVELIAKSMARFGQAQIILIDGDDGPSHGEIIAGHGRVLAAARLGWDSLMVAEANGWSAEEKRAYRIADNQLAVAPWDMSLLKLEAKDLKLGGFDMGLLGFDAPSMFALLAAEPAVDAEAEAAPELPKTPVVRTGDLWVLGNHRLLCGDATLAADVAKLLGEDKPHLMVTDPPYGVEYDPEWRSEKSKHRNWTSAGTFLSKARAIGTTTHDDRADWREAWTLFPGDIVYVWHGGLQAHITAASLDAVGLKLRSQIIWVKQHFAISRGDYHWQHEACWYAVRKTGNWTGDRKQSTIWAIQNHGAFGGEKEDVTSGHGTQKPIECMKRPIENNSEAGDFVYDPFVGSGTTIIAAEIAARRCLAMEIDPGYTQVSIERWQTYTGKEATLDGRSFEDIKAERLRSKGRSRKVRGVVSAGDTGANGKRRSRVGAKRKGSRVGSPAV